MAAGFGVLAVPWGVVDAGPGPNKPGAFLSGGGAWETGVATGTSQEAGSRSPWGAETVPPTAMYRIFPIVSWAAHPIHVLCITINGNHGQL